MVRRRATRLVAILLMALMSLGSLATAAAENPAHFHGVVLDHTGRPVPDAAVMVYQETRQEPLGRLVCIMLAETKTSTEGQFETEDRTGTWTPGQDCYVVAHKTLLGWARAHTEIPAIVQLGRPQPLGGILTDEKGRPIAGAQVRLFLKNEPMVRYRYRARGLFFPGDESWHVTTTDHNGRFLFENMPADTTVDFRIDAPGRPPIWTFCDFGLEEGEQYHVGQTDIHITLPPAARIEGCVVEKGTKKPVSGLAVLARPHNRPGRDYYHDPVPVDADGRFALTGLRPGAYALQVAAIEGKEQQWFDDMPVVAVESGKTLDNITLEVNRGATLEIVARDMTSDTLLETARITVGSDRHTRHGVTDADGCVCFRLPAGKYDLSGIKEGHVTFATLKTPAKVQLSQGQVCRKEFGLNCRAVKVSATVVNTAGQPQPNVSIHLWPWCNCAYTDAKGQFENTSYSIGKPTRQLVAARDEASGQAAIVMLNCSKGNHHSNEEIVLKPAYALTGRVVDPNGSALPGAHVELLLGETNRFPSLLDSAVSTCVTDANGAYHFKALLANQSDLEYYAVAAYASGYNGNSVSPIRPDGPVDKLIKLEPIVLKPADQVISGIVVDTNGTPVSGALVQTPKPRMEDAKQPYRLTLADRNGRFCLEGLCTGPAKLSSVSSEAPRTWGHTQTDGGERNVRIMLGQTLEYARYLVGTPLPDWDRLGLSGMSDRCAGKAILLCLIDHQQRPSRHCLRQLADRAALLSQHDVATVVVPLSDAPGGAGIYDERFHVARCDDDPTKLRKTLGVQSLPWLILTDSEHVIVGENLSVTGLDSLLERPSDGR